MRAEIAWIGLILTLPFPACAATGAGRDDPPSQVEVSDGDLGRQIDDILTAASRNGFGGAVMVEVEGRLIYAAGHGWADREAGRPFSIDTIAQLGSNTKAFTAAAIADLQRRGLVDLDAPVGRYLPDAPQPGASATIRALLTHTSGMREYCGQDFGIRSLAEFKAVCLAAPLDQAISPDSGVAYSNPGYSTLAAVVETVSGETLDHYIRARLLAPLGIRDGGYAFAGVDGDRFAAGYSVMGRQAPISERLNALGEDYWNLKGNGGMQMSARSAYRWHLGLSCRGGMIESLRRLIVRPLTPPAGNPAADGTRVSEGYGWAFRTTAGGTPFKLAHTGSDGTFLTYQYWRPYDGGFLFFVSNNGETEGRTVLTAIRRALGDSRQRTDDDLKGLPDAWTCGQAAAAGQAAHAGR